MWWACYRYIEANPLRARMVERPEEHLWSSYARNALGRADPLVVEHECYRALSASEAARQALYRQIFAEGVDVEMINTLRGATQRGWVPGREPFRRQIEAALGRRVEPPVRGGPRKDRQASPR